MLASLVNCSHETKQDTLVVLEAHLEHVGMADMVVVDLKLDESLEHVQQLLRESHQLGLRSTRLKDHLGFLRSLDYHSTHGVEGEVLLLRNCNAALVE